MYEAEFYSKENGVYVTVYAHVYDEGDYLYDGEYIEIFSDPEWKFDEILDESGDFVVLSEEETEEVYQILNNMYWDKI